jgi:hypothetical protein
VARDSAQAGGGIVNGDRWHFWVPGQLPGMNEIVATAKGAGGRGYTYAKVKKRWTNDVALHVIAAGVPKGLKMIRIECHWIEPLHENKSSRDPDNIEAGQKFLWDGLVLAKVIPNDKRANNAGSSHRHSNGCVPGVEVIVVDASDAACVHRHSEEGRS